MATNKQQLQEEYKNLQEEYKELLDIQELKRKIQEQKEKNQELKQKIQEQNELKRLQNELDEFINEPRLQKEHKEQYIHTFGFSESELKALHDVLRDGYFTVDDEDVYIDDGYITKEEFYQIIVPKEQQDYKRNANTFYKNLRNLFPMIKDHRPTINGQRVYCLKFPDIKVLRETYESHVGKIQPQ